METIARITGGLVVTLLLGLGVAGPALGAPAPAPTATAGGAVGTSELAVLRHPAQAFTRPDGASRPVMTVSSTRPITGERTVLPVIAHATDRRGGRWLRVLLPGRPNSHAGWVAARSTTPAVTPWQIVVRLSTRRVTAVRRGRALRTFLAVIGKPSTPTPVGRFFVEETVALGRQDVGAPYALALSARSNVLQEFAGGPGQIALHGTNNVGGIAGTAASHGCLRLDTAAITWLATRIGPGTPVTITR